MSGKDIRSSVGFLGQEFLLWLFCRCSEDSFFNLEEFGGESIELFLEEQITLDSFRGDGYTETIKAKEITELEDVKNSIKLGRIPSAVKARVIQGQLEWAFQLKASPITVKAVKLPLVAENEQDEVKHMRLILLEKLDMIVNNLFALFLLERETKDMGKEIKKSLGL